MHTIRRSVLCTDPVFLRQAPITVGDGEFIKIVEAAADLDDYRCGKFFVPEQLSDRFRQEPSFENADSLTQTLSSFESAQTDQCAKDDLLSCNSRPHGLLRLRDPAVLPPWARGIREMLDGLAKQDFTTKHTSPVYRLCECGSRYGLERLQSQISPEIRNLICAKAKKSLQIDLRRLLARVLRPCFTLEQEASRLAYDALRLYRHATDRIVETTHLRGTPFDQLCFTFKMFPVLARLWSQLISQWCDHIAEVLLRLMADRIALSHAFFGGQPTDKIIDLLPGLSDLHNEGRSVALIQFESGSVIYKPRPGDGEEEWLCLLRWMNSQSFRPRLRAARILRRKDYCWMERVRSEPCKDEAAARRFYLRVGGLLAAAYLLKMVDCHRDNLIACGEYPILVDAETLCHETKTQSPVDALWGTGFLPSSRRGASYQYRSSALGKTTSGKHTPHLAGRPLSAGDFEAEIINGFQRGWRCLLGTRGRRAAFVRRLQRLRRRERRWIYWSTRNYHVIRRASIQPAALRSGIERHFIIARLCEREAVSHSVLGAEIRALERLDIPYLTREKTAGPIDREDNAALTKIAQELRRAVHA